MKFSEYEAHIVVDGEELPEYSVEYDEKTRTAVCWVPSQAGKAFSVTAMPLRQSDINVVANAYADGTFVGGKAYRKDKFWTAMTVSHVDTSATTSRPLLFASIELTDEHWADDDTLLNSANLKELGEITVRMSRVEILSENAPGPFSNRTSSLTNSQIHERSKKAMTHKINLGPEIIELPRTYISCNYLERLCSLTFKYRSIDVLRANGIAPPASISPSTDGKRKVPEDDDGDDDDGQEQEQDSDEGEQEEEDKAQLKALLEQINALEAKMAKKGTKPKSKKVKTEHRPALIPGEVIDLTL